MSAENVETVRRAFAGFEAGITRGDYGGAWETGAVADDAELIPAPEVAGDASYLGRDGFVEFIQLWTEDFERWRIELEEFIDAGDDRVLGLFRQTAIGKGSGVAVDQRYAQVFDLRAGVIIRITIYLDRAEALAAAGLRE
jgi:ketosteroid isomerase-like protein